MGIVIVALAILIGRLDQKKEVRELKGELASLRSQADRLDQLIEQLVAERGVVRGLEAENEDLKVQLQGLETQLGEMKKAIDQTALERELIQELQKEIQTLKVQTGERGLAIVVNPEEKVGVQQEEAPAAPTLKTLSITTDSSWKVFDAKMEGWAEASFEDRNWLKAEELFPVSIGDFPVKAVWFPERPYPFKAFFRRSFEVQGSRVISGRMIVKLYSAMYRFWGNLLHIYLNGSLVGSVKEAYSGDTEFDVGPLLRPGRNLIAVEADFGGRPDADHWWGLVLIVRSE
jgi:seryl-tRNA synthetase